MNRIFEISDLTIDLGNIKSLRTEQFSGSSTGVYVIIELLKGKEYVENPVTEELELFEPQIKKGFGSIERAEYFMKLIREEWNKYLKYREEK
ncbi:hypothetical protein V6B16_03755 [Salinimicrobium catena]|uniref:hypothetical protein n=1 Tax=Salinimicrobium catena TaxID=390640 RepID=UPI002FE43D5E